MAAIETLQASHHNNTFAVNGLMQDELSVIYATSFCLVETHVCLEVGGAAAC